MLAGTRETERLGAENAARPSPAIAEQQVRAVLGRVVMRCFEWRVRCVRACERACQKGAHSLTQPVALVGKSQLHFQEAVTADSPPTADSHTAAPRELES